VTAVVALWPSLIDLTGPPVDSWWAWPLITVSWAVHVDVAHVAVNAAVWVATVWVARRCRFDAAQVLVAALSGWVAGVVVHLLSGSAAHLVGGSAAVAAVTGLMVNTQERAWKAVSWMFGVLFAVGAPGSASQRVHLAGWAVGMLYGWWARRPEGPSSGR
jgi:hypothetical protein